RCHWHRRERVIFSTSSDSRYVAARDVPSFGRTAAAEVTADGADVPESAAGDGHCRDTERGRGDTGSEIQIVSHALDWLEEFVRREGDGNSPPRVCHPAVFNQEPPGATRKITGNGVEPEPHNLGHVEAALGLLHHVLRGRLARAENEVRGGGTNAAGAAT